VVALAPTSCRAIPAGLAWTGPCHLSLQFCL